MRTVAMLLVAVALSACVDFDPTTGQVIHGPATCGTTSAYPTYPAADARTADAGCPAVPTTTKDSGYY